MQTDDKIIKFPEAAVTPCTEEEQQELEELLKKIDEEVELMLNYLYEGGSENPLIRRYQESLVEKYDNYIEQLKKGKR